MNKYEINGKLKMDFLLNKNKKSNVNSILLNNEIKCDKELKKNDVKEFSNQREERKHIDDQKKEKEEEKKEKIIDIDKKDFSNFQIKKDSIMKYYSLNNNLKNYCMKYKKMKENVPVNPQELNSNINSPVSLFTNFNLKEVNKDKLNKKMELSADKKNEKKMNEGFESSFETNKKGLHINEEGKEIKKSIHNENKEENIFSIYKDSNINNLSFPKEKLNANNKRDYKIMQIFGDKRNNLEKNNKKNNIFHINDEKRNHILGENENKLLNIKEEKFSDKNNSAIPNDEIKNKEFVNIFEKDKKRKNLNTQMENDFCNKEDNLFGKNIFENEDENGNEKYKEICKSSLSFNKCKQMYKSLFSPVKYKELKKNVDISEDSKNILNELCENNKNIILSTDTRNMKDTDEISYKEKNKVYYDLIKCNQKNKKNNQNNYEIINSNKKDKENIINFIDNIEKNKINKEDIMSSKKSETVANMPIHKTMNCTNLNGNFKKNKYVKKTNYNSILKSNFNIMFNKVDNSSADKVDDECIQHDSKIGINNNLKCYIKQSSCSNSSKSEDINADDYNKNAHKIINKDNNSSEIVKESFNKYDAKCEANNNGINVKNVDSVFERKCNMENINRNTLKENINRNVIKENINRNVTKENINKDMSTDKDFVKIKEKIKKSSLFLKKNSGSFQNKNKSTNQLKFLKNNVFKNIYFNRKFKIEDVHNIKLNYDNLNNIQKIEEEKIKILYNKFYQCSFCIDKNIENICLKKYDIFDYCKFCKKLLNLIVTHGAKYKGVLVNINFIHSDIQNLIFTYKCDKQHIFNISLFHIIHNLWCPHDFCLFQYRDNYSKNYSTEYFRLKELDTMEKQKKLFLQAKIFCLINSYAMPDSSKNINSEYANDIDRIIKNANDPWEVLQINKFTKIESYDKTELRKEARKNYYMLALKVHPDKNKNHNASLAMNILTNSMKAIMSI